MCPQECPTVLDPMDCSLPDSPVHGIFQVRILGWIAISCSRGSSQPKDQTHISCISCIGRQILYHWHHRESPKPPFHRHTHKTIERKVLWLKPDLRVQILTHLASSLPSRLPLSCLHRTLGSTRHIYETSGYDYLFIDFETKLAVKLKLTTNLRTSKKEKKMFSEITGSALTELGQAGWV